MKRIFLSFILLFAVFTTAFAQFRMSEGSKKIATAIAFIENLYVDKVYDAKLAEDAVKSLLEKLDPHSTYISADEVKEMNESLEGNFDGIGISFNMVTDTLYVIEALAGGPSEKIGLRAGDKILYVDDTLIAGVKMSTKDVMSRLKGPKGTNVTVSVLRKGVPDLVNFKITRAKIPIYSIDAAYMMDKNIGYIRPMRFGATTTNEFRDAVQKLKQQGLENLILDLRQNGGGYMAPAIDLADDFLDKGKLIVYTEGNTQPRRDELSTSKGVFEKGKLAILIDEGSASASEILSGAVQDWDRGVIIGRRSFGKGLVQRPIPFPDESMIRLTVARYYTPSGRSIQKPYTKGDARAYAMDIIERSNHGELQHQDSVHFPDSLKYRTLMNERIVYGGGGIMPDYFVPMDTAFYSKYYAALWNKSLIPKTTYNEVDQFREEILAKYPSADDFYKNYEVSEPLLNKLISAGEKESIEYDDAGFNKSKNVLKTQLKAYIARDVYDTETSVKIFNKDNEILNKAYEIIKDDKLYHSLLKGK
jgi:carboxyl-terminal processing protease